MKKLTITLILICFIFLSGCSVIKLTVSFYDEFNTLIEVKEVSFGKCVEELKIEPKEGYKFIGWYNKDKRWDFKINRVYKDIKLVAVFEKEKYQVFFDTDGADLLLPLTYEYNKQFTLPRITKNEFEFAWWLLDGKPCPYTLRMPSHDLYVSAVWYKDSKGWKINKDTLVAYKGSAEEFRVPGYYAFDIDLVELTTIGTSAFLNNQIIKKVEISEGIKKIDSFAFMECTNLENVTFPNTLEYIGMQAFWGCKSLKYVVIPESVKKIGTLSFMNMNNDFIIYTTFKEAPSTWDETFVLNNKIYYQDEWEYSPNGVPTLK